MSYRFFAVLFFLFLTSFALTPLKVLAADVFPGTNWQEASPESQGVDSAKLQAAINTLRNQTGTSNDGVNELAIIRNGYLIWKGSNIDNMHGVWSMTKAFTSTVHGLLIDDGRTQLDTLARTVVPSLAANYPNVSLRHFNTMTSGYYAVGDEPKFFNNGGSYCHGPSTTPFNPGTPWFTPPGSRFAYWDSAMNQFGNVLTRIAGEPMKNYFQRRIADRIGMNPSRWSWGDNGIVDGILVNSGSGNNNRHVQITAREMARFGHLFLNRGNWNGQQLISANWVDQATRVQVPANTPLVPFADARCNANLIDSRGIYGFNWWVNGVQANGQRLWPDAPLGTFSRSGANNNRLFVIPEWRMVIVRLGQDGNVWQFTDSIENTFLRMVGQALQAPSNACGQTVTSSLRAWQPMGLCFTGPSSSQTATNPNPFLSYRMQVKFTGPAGQVYDVPGYFDGDGQGGASGNVWRAGFTPDQAGSWSYQVSFRQGNNAAIDPAVAGTSVSGIDGRQGNFTIGSRDAAAPGFLAKGRLVRAAGTYYLRTLGDNRYWLKGGTDSPENFLGYQGFVNTRGNPNPPAQFYAFHGYSSHAQDWRQGDPDWGGGQGRAIIGALNHLANKRVNSIYVLLMNIGGDGKDVWPYSGSINANGGAGVNNNIFFDLAKLKQWERVFDHAQRRGIHLHFVLTEGERNNKQELDNATLGNERKLYYREMVARFGHHNALSWNLSEEYDHPELVIAPAMVKSWAQYLRSVDPYKHPITVHNGPEAGWDPFFGDALFDQTSYQWHGQVSYGPKVESLRAQAAARGRTIAIHVDETIATGRSDDERETIVDHGTWRQYVYGQVYIRKNVIYPIYFSGGAVELILEEMLATENFRLYDKVWDYLYYARRFVEDQLPFWEMSPADGLLSGAASGAREGAQVFAKPGEVYAIYLPRANPSGSLNLSGVSGQFNLNWYDPRTGQFVGAARVINGGGSVALGAPPSAANDDWVVLVKRSGGTPTQPAVTSLTLINADTDQAIAGFDPIASGAVLNFATLPTRNLNVRANTAGTVGSVRFTLNGTVFSTENTAPYALAGDTGGNYVAWTPALGSHALVATAYPQSNAGGSAGGSVSINFSVTNAAAPTLSLSANPTAVASGGSSTLTWSSTNATACTASGAWAGSKTLSGSQTIGNLTQTSTFTLVCQGSSGQISRTVTVSVGATAPAVTSLTLMNADTDQPIAGFNPIGNGATLNLSTLPTRNLNIRANTAGNVGSVLFRLNGSPVRTENTAPYAMMGDTQGDYAPWTPPLGSHSVSATAYPQSNAGGAAGGGVTVNFTVTQ